MKPKTEELLCYLLYCADVASRPTWRNLDQSFEEWAYRNGFARQVEALETGRLIERQCGPAVGRIYRLTDEGRVHSLGGRNPEELWRATWDGKWRVVFFDIPRIDNTARDRLRKALRQDGFGCLQHSLWISPRPLSTRIQDLCGHGDDLGTILTFVGRPDTGTSDAGIVIQAWDFDRINRQYAAYEQVLKRFPRGLVHDKRSAQSFRAWAEQERSAWLEAVQPDPLLPTRLTPRGYLGRRVWARRQRVLGRAAECLSSPQTLTYVRQSLGTG